MDCLLCGKLWSEQYCAECRVHLVGVNRLSACRVFSVHSWQNGTDESWLGQKHQTKKTRMT